MVTTAACRLVTLETVAAAKIEANKGKFLDQASMVGDRKRRKTNRFSHVCFWKKKA